MRLIAFLFLFLISACSPKPTLDDAEDQIPLRASPTYVHWLETQSLWYMAPDLNKIVQGNSLGWQNSSAGQGHDALLSILPTWFHLDPWEVITKDDENDPILLSLYNENFSDILFLMNVHGIYLSPAAQPANEWSLDQTSHENSISYNFAESITSDEIYRQWQQRNIFMAGDMLSPNLGVGSDFLLATRAVRDYPSLFMMAEIPRELWPNDNADKSRILSEEEKNILQQNNILPIAFSRDSDEYKTSGGFAITPPISGIDGNSRRWAYRYHKDPSQPVLHVDSPTQSAEIILSASIIRQVGVLQQPLTGVDIAPLWAQDASLKNENQTPEPAISSIRSWNRSIHRYGGWSLLRNPLPMNYIPSLLSNGCDFVPDTIIAPALQKSLLESDAMYLRDNLQQAFDLEIDFSTLWRASPTAYGEEIFTDEYMQAWNTPKVALINDILEDLVESVDPNFEYLTTPKREIWSKKALTFGAGLAASLAELTPDDAILISKIIQKNTPFDSENEYEKELILKIERATQIQYSFLTFSAMLPGLFMLDGHDLTGTVLVPEQLTSIQEHEFPAWTPVQSSKNHRKITTSQGHPKAYTLYAPLNIQLKDPESLASKISEILELRQIKGVAQGEIIGMVETDSTKVFGLITRLPDESFLLTYINLSSEKVISRINFPIPNRPHYLAKDLLSNQDLNIKDNTISLIATPWQVRIVQIYNPED